MTSWRLWQLLLVARSPFPLFIRIAPRAHRQPEGSIWRFLAWYTIVGLYFSVIVAPFMFRSVALGILFVVFGSPAFITVLMGAVASPFVLFGGVFVGLTLANQISDELETLGRNAITDLMHATPPGRWGVIRAVSAAYLRRKDRFFGAGIYEMIYAHLALTLGFALPVGTLAVIFVAAQQAENASLNFGLANPETRGLIVATFVAAGIFPPILAALIHLDFRLSLMTGTTTGIFGGTVTLQRFDAWTGALTAFLGAGLVGSLVIVGTVAIATALTPTSYTPIASALATLVGWGLALVAREQIVRWLWGQIIDHEGLDAL
jgi:hypothetical protein